MVTGKGNCGLSDTSATAEVSGFFHGLLRDGKASKRKDSPLLVRGWKSPTWPGSFSSIRFSGAYAHRCGKTDGADRQQGVKKPAGIEDRTSAGDHQDIDQKDEHPRVPARPFRHI